MDKFEGGHQVVAKISQIIIIASWLLLSSGLQQLVFYYDRLPALPLEERPLGGHRPRISENTLVTTLMTTPR
jgi:hypothetical protein